MKKVGGSKRKKVLAAAWHPGSANAIIPVIKRLTKEAKVDVVTIGHQFSEKAFQGKGIGYRTINSYGLKDVSLDSMSQLLQAESPDLVLIGTSTPTIQDMGVEKKDIIEQTLTLAAKDLGIKSLAVLDVWAKYSVKFSDIYTKEKLKFLPDKIAIMDQVAKEAMLGEGFDKEKLVITGNPHFDSLPQKAKNFTQEQKRIVREKAGLGSEFLPFFAGTNFKSKKDIVGYWDLENIALISEVLNDLPEAQKRRVGVVIKLHPRTPESDLVEINQYLERCSKKRIKLVKDIDTHQLVLASDFTLVSWSTVGVEAVYMGKSCISLQPGLKGKDILILSQKGIIPVGYTIKDCKNELKRVILDNEYREKELPRRVAGFRTDGKATVRVTKLVYEMLK